MDPTSFDRANYINILSTSDLHRSRDLDPPIVPETGTEREKQSRVAAGQDAENDDWGRAQFAIARALRGPPTDPNSTSNGKLTQSRAIPSLFFGSMCAASTVSATSAENPHLELGVVFKRRGDEGARIERAE